MDKKFKLMPAYYMIVDDVRYFRIKALREIKNPLRIVRAGEMGGFVRTVHNLSEYDTCWVYDNACVKGRAMVTGDAAVCEQAVVNGNARIGGNAHVHGHAIVYGNAKVRDHCEITNNAKVYDNAVVGGDARILNNARVYGNAVVCDDAVVSGFSHATGDAIICGKYELTSGVRNKGNWGMSTRERKDYVGRQI